MNVRELIERLSKFNPELEVAILDGFNGGGQPRALNLGPHVEGEDDIKERAEFGDPLDYSDLSTPAGKPIVLMGYGCY